MLSPNLKLKHIVQSLPKEVFVKDTTQVWLMVIKTIVAVTLGMAAIAFAPWYLLPLAWVFTDTTMTGCFVIGHDCAHRSFSTSRKVNDLVGHLFMLTLIYPFYGWRYGHNNHHKHTNKMDVDNAWQPWRPEDYKAAPTWLQVFYQAMRGRLWWLASLPHWALVHFDWRKFPAGKTRDDVKFSALVAIIGAVVMFPVMIGRLRQAHAIVKENWGEYIKERKFTWEMMKDITDKCHLYEQNEFYQTFREFDANN